MSLLNRWGPTVALITLMVLSAWIPAFAAEFVPEKVFGSRSTGQGELKLAFKEPQSFTVQSNGSVQPDGTLHLDQTIRLEGEPVRKRSWVMRRTGPSTYSATLTDAAGPVAVRIDGSRMSLRYRLTNWGLVMHQTLDLADDGRTVTNRGRIRLLGIPVGWLHETIRLEH